MGKLAPLIFRFLQCLQIINFCLVFTDTNMSSGDTAMAFKTWEMSNNIETLSSVDEIFKFDRQQQQEILHAKPWQKE